MSIKQAIKTINEEIVRLETERSDLQEACKHPTYTIVDYQWRIAATFVTRYCTECNSTLGTPSDAELEDFANGDSFKIYEYKPKVEGCHCWECDGSPNDGFNLNWELSPLSNCDKCNKRGCPKTTFHGNKCTNSNEAGQKGSAYE